MMPALPFMLCLCLAPPSADGEIERLRQEALAYAERQAPAEDGAQYHFRVVGTPSLPPGASGSLRFEPSHLSKREPTGRFFAAFRVFAGGRLLGTTRVDMDGEWRGTVLTARTALARKSIPGSESLEAVPFQGTPPPGAIGRWPEGFRLRQPVGIGKVITRADLEPIPLVNTGDRVRLILVSGGLTVSTEGIARSQGAMGDRVRIELPSRRVLQASVDGEGTARLDMQGAR